MRTVGRGADHHYRALVIGILISGLLAIIGIAAGLRKLIESRRPWWKFWS
jgi:hypothetical protein